jgi:hypothetical protein
MRHEGYRNLPPHPFNGVDLYPAGDSKFKTRLLRYCRVLETDLFLITDTGIDRILLEELLPNLVALVLDGRYHEYDIPMPPSIQGYTAIDGVDVPLNGGDLNAYSGASETALSSPDCGRLDGAEGGSEDAVVTGISPSLEEVDEDIQIEEAEDDPGNAESHIIPDELFELDHLINYTDRRIIPDEQPVNWRLKRIVRRNIDRLGQCITELEEELDCGEEAVFRFGQMCPIDPWYSDYMWDWDTHIPPLSYSVKTTTMLFYDKDRPSRWSIPFCRWYPSYVIPPPASRYLRYTTFMVLIGTVMTHLLYSKATVRMINTASFDPVWIGLRSTASCSEITEHVELLFRRRLSSIITLQGPDKEEGDRLQARLEFVSLRAYVDQVGWEGVLSQDEATDIRGHQGQHNESQRGR